MEELIERGEVRYAWIGVSTRTLTASLAGEAGTAVERGAAIECVVPGSPAESAGLRAGDREVTVDGLTFLAGGDVVVAIDGDAWRRARTPDGSWRRACVPDRRRASPSCATASTWRSRSSWESVRPTPARGC